MTPGQNRGREGVRAWGREGLATPSPRSDLRLAELALRGSIKVLALTGAIVTAVVALVLLAETLRIAVLPDPGAHRALFFLGHGLGFALATALMVSSSHRASAARLGLGVLLVAMLVLLVATGNV
jgi:hypothetical protein